MIAFLSLFTDFWSFLLAAAGAMWALFANQRARTVKAEASQKVAEAEKREADAQAAVARSKVAAGESARILRDHWSR